MSVVRTFFLLKNFVELPISFHDHFACSEIQLLLLYLHHAQKEEFFPHKFLHPFLDVIEFPKFDFRHSTFLRHMTVILLEFRSPIEVAEIEHNQSDFL